MDKDLPPPPPNAKVKLGYVPKVKQRGNGSAGKRYAKLSEPVCPVCKAKVSQSQLAQHLRIELLDPKWREQRERANEKVQGSNLVYDQGVAIVENLKKMAEYRTDIFGGESVNLAKKLKDKEAEVQKDAVMWDGHTATVSLVVNKASKQLSIDEQIEAIHQSKGLKSNRAEIGPRLNLGVQPT